MRLNYNPFNLRSDAGCKPVVRRANTIERDTRDEALSEVEAALARGNAVKMVNVAGKHFVTELVMQ